MQTLGFGTFGGQQLEHCSIFHSYKPYPRWKVPVQSRTEHKTTITAGSPHPTRQYLMKFLLTSEGCFLMSVTVQEQIFKKITLTQANESDWFSCFDIRLAFVQVMKSNWSDIIQRTAKKQTYHNFTYGYLIKWYPISSWISTSRQVRRGKLRKS